MSKRNAYVRWKLVSLICLALAGINGTAWAAGSGRVDRIIIKYKDSAAQKTQTAEQRVTVQNARGTLRHTKRKTGDNADIYYLDSPRTSHEARLIAQELMQRADVEYAAPDYRRYPSKVPNDPRYIEQWYLKRSDIEPGAINAEEAWGDTPGNASIVIAVIDTGILPHEDISGMRVLQGYDFYSDAARDNDGEPGPDDDPTDPGDAVTAGECGTNDPKNNEPSSWHGTAVSGLMIATTDNVGIAGVDHQASLLPIRVLGKCGGFSSDISKAILWAAGVSVPDAPPNPHPADVINLSLGSLDSCIPPEQNAIDAAVARGVVVVAAAGNEASEAMIDSPAACNHVIAVAATSRQGAETCYTNVSADVDLSAPGGNDNKDLCDGIVPNDLILTTSNNGTTTPASPTYEYLLGTSFAAPLVSGTAALLKAIDRNLSPDAIEGVLKTTARAFPTGTNDGYRDCKNIRCGAGIVDAHGAVRMAVTGVDTVANPFRFEDRSNAELNSTIISNSVKITGINIPVPVKISGDGEYSIDGSSFTNTEGTIEPSQNIRIKLRSAASHGITVSARLTIGGIRDTFSVTTRQGDSGGSGGGGGGGGEAAWMLPLLLAWRLRKRGSTTGV